MPTTQHNLSTQYRVGEIPMSHHSFEDFAMPRVWALIETNTEYNVTTARVYTPNPWHPNEVRFYDWTLNQDGIWRRTMATASPTRPSSRTITNTITTTNNDRKNMSIDKTITVTGIKFWNWTITAKVIATFAYNPNTNTFSHTQNSIGTNDGDIFGQGNDSSVPSISFSNHVSVDAVRWAKMNADAGMNIGQQDDWIDAIYTSAELNAAVTAELELLNTASTIVKENNND